MLYKWIERLQKELDLPDSVKDEQGGRYELPMDEETSISIYDVPPGMRLTALVVPLPQNDKERFLEYLLHGNLLGQSTEGATLGLTEDGKQLTLTREIDYAIDYPQFTELLERFFNSVEFWREEALLHKRGKLFS